MTTTMKNGLNMSYVGVWTMSMGGAVGQPDCSKAVLRTASPLKISQKQRLGNPRIVSVRADHSVAVSMLRDTSVDMLDSVVVRVGWCGEGLRGLP